VARSGEDSATVAAAVDVLHRFRGGAAGFATARAGVAWDRTTTTTYAEAVAGLRWRW
jgi:hypothetical protein